MGGMLNNFSIIWTGVIWKTPLIFQQVSFWATCKVWRREAWLMSVNQTWNPYVRMGRMREWKRVCHHMRENPQTELPRTPKLVMVLHAWLASVLV